MEWKVGDEAMCIREGIQTRRGLVYTVSEVIEAGEVRFSISKNKNILFQTKCLRFIELPHKDWSASAADRFVKVPRMETIYG